MLKADFIRLLKDDSEEVLHMLVPQMGNTLELFCQYGTLSRQSVTPASMEIGRAILKCQYELTNGYNWRLLTHFIHQLEHLPNCMPPDFIHQHFTPVILTSAVQGVRLIIFILHSLILVILLSIKLSLIFTHSHG